MGKVSDMRRRTYSWAGCSVIILGILMIGIGAYQLFQYKCLWWDCAPRRNFTVFDLNLPPELYPSQAEVFELQADRGNITAIEEAMGGGSWHEGKAIYIVDKFATVKQAESWYQLRSQKDFFTAPMQDTSLYGVVVKYKSLSADDYSVKCGYIIEQVHCILRARYKEFYIYFNSSLDDTEMTPNNYVNILEYIDRRMMELLID